MRAKKLLTIAVLALSPLWLPAPAQALVILGDRGANLDRVATRDGGTRVDLLTGGAFADDALGLAGLLVLRRTNKGTVYLFRFTK